MKFNLIVADPPYSFSDKLSMSKTKRGAQSNYDVLSFNDLKQLDVKSLAAEDSVLVLWVPSSLLQNGLDIMKSWNFEQKQTFVWVKTKKTVFSDLIKSVKSACQVGYDWPNTFSLIKRQIHEFDLNNIVSIFMGRIFRQTHEIALIGTRGKVGELLQNKSQRSVMLAENKKHSAKPEGLQDRLDIMYPNVPKLEIFARRERKGWHCIGNECPNTVNVDIKDSIEILRLKQNESITTKLDI